MGEGMRSGYRPGVCREIIRVVKEIPSGEKFTAGDVCGKFMHKHGVSAHECGMILRDGLAEKINGTHYWVRL
jgi:hypothetical protein